MATGRHPRPSSPSFNTSSAITSQSLSLSSSNPTDHSLQTPLRRTHSQQQQQQQITLSYTSQPNPTPTDPSVSRNLTSVPTSSPRGVGRTASTALPDDTTSTSDLPSRPRKRPRLHPSDREETNMKFEGSATPERAASPELREANGSGSAIVKNGIVKETNGVSSSSRNGTTTNGSRFSDVFFGHSRQEVTRLMIQAMNDLGYTYVTFVFLFASCMLMISGELLRHYPENLDLAQNHRTSPTFETLSYRETGKMLNFILQTFPSRRTPHSNRLYSSSESKSSWKL